MEKTKAREDVCGPAYTTRQVAKLLRRSSSLLLQAKILGKGGRIDNLADEHCVPLWDADQVSEWYWRFMYRDARVAWGLLPRTTPREPLREAPMPSPERMGVCPICHGDAILALGELNDQCYCWCPVDGRVYAKDES